MQFHELPLEARDILAKYAAPPRLVAHLTIVHDVALKLIRHLKTSWPMLEFDHQRVLFGAATYDIGKTIATNELSSPHRIAFYRSFEGLLFFPKTIEKTIYPCYTILYPY